LSGKGPFPTPPFFFFCLSQFSFPHCLLPLFFSPLLCFLVRSFFLARSFPFLFARCGFRGTQRNFNPALGFCLDEDPKKIVLFPTILRRLHDTLHVVLYTPAPNCNLTHWNDQSSEVVLFFCPPTGGSPHLSPCLLLACLLGLSSQPPSPPIEVPPGLVRSSGPHFFCFPTTNDFLFFFPSPKSQADGAAKGLSFSPPPPCPTAYFSLVFF